MGLVATNGLLSSKGGEGWGEEATRRQMPNLLPNPRRQLHPSAPVPGRSKLRPLWRDHIRVGAPLRAPIASSVSGKSGTGLPHSKTWRNIVRPPTSRSVLECGSPVPLSIDCSQVSTRLIARFKRVSSRFHVAAPGCTRVKRRPHGLLWAGVWGKVDLILKANWNYFLGFGSGLATTFKSAKCFATWSAYHWVCFLSSVSRP